MIVVISGPEGSGKSTQAQLLAERLDVPLVSPGSLVRAELKKGTPLGRRYQKISQSGGYLSDADINSLIIPRLENIDWQAGFVLEGYPRSLAQAQALDQWLNRKGLVIEKFIYLDLDEKMIMDRLMRRGRFDDTPDRIQGRLRDFRKHLSKIKVFYQRQGKWCEVDGRSAAENVFALVRQALNR